MAVPRGAPARTSAAMASSRAAMFAAVVTMWPAPGKAGPAGQAR